MTEIKKELKGDNMSVKANAISKLTYVSIAIICVCLVYLDKIEEQLVPLYSLWEE